MEATRHSGPCHITKKGRAKADPWFPYKVLVGDNGSAVRFQVAAIEDTLRRAEQGDLKLRVRVLESERAFQRMDLVQNTMGSAIMASLFLNAGILVTATNPPVNGAVRSLSLAAKTLLLTAALFGLQIPTNYLKLRQFDKRSEQLGIKRA